MPDEKKEKLAKDVEKSISDRIKKAQTNLADFIADVSLFSTQKPSSFEKPVASVALEYGKKVGVQLKETDQVDDLLDALTENLIECRCFPNFREGINRDTLCGI